MPYSVIPSLKIFQVTPDIPEVLKPLAEMATNLWWTWNYDAAELFRRLDRTLWDSTNHNPVKLLGRLSQEQLNDVANDAGYIAQLERVYESFKAQFATPGWFGSAHAKDADTRIAYFSAEFGLHESLPIYSGGLGVLAGDHLKSASELCLPLVGVGLLYRQGYFQQYLSGDGWQQEAYPELDFHSMAVELQRHTDGSPIQVRVDMPETPSSSASGESRSDGSRFTCSTPISKRTPRAIARSPHVSTAAARRCASARRSSSASAASARWRRWASSPPSST
jgi:glycogen phosphorylase